LALALTETDAGLMFTLLPAPTGRDLLAILDRVIRRVARRSTATPSGALAKRCTLPRRLALVDDLNVDLSMRKQGEFVLLERIGAGCTAPCTAASIRKLGRDAVVRGLLQALHAETYLPFERRVNCALGSVRRHR
jgi:hypothetical protein